MRVGSASISERERQHKGVVRVLGMLVIALAKANRREAEPTVEGRCGGIVAAHFKDEALRPSPRGGVRERPNEPAGDATAPVSLMHAEREKLCLIGGELPKDEADGLWRGCHARQERDRA